MASVIVLLLILRLGSVLTLGFEQILLQQPIFGADAAQTLDTFVYFRGINGGDWGLATAAGLVKGVDRHGPGDRGQQAGQTLRRRGGVLMAERAGLDGEAVRRRSPP